MRDAVTADHPGLRPPLLKRRGNASVRGWFRVRQACAERRYRGRPCAKIRTFARVTSWPGAGDAGTGEFATTMTRYYDYQHSVWADGESKTVGTKLSRPTGKQLTQLGPVKLTTVLSYSRKLM